jgi:hypothetical protein
MNIVGVNKENSILDQGFLFSIYNYNNVTLTIVYVVQYNKFEVIICIL